MSYFLVIHKRKKSSKCNISLNVSRISLKSGVFGSSDSIPYHFTVFTWFFHRLLLLGAKFYTSLRNVKSVTRIDAEYRKCDASCECVYRMWTTAQRQWVSSSRIPLVFVSLASTVDHHNRLCIVFWNFSPRIFACI